MNHASTRQTAITRRRWTVTEDSLLRELYPQIQPVALARQLGRTEKSVKSRAKVLGVTRGMRRRWTEAEDAILRAGYARTFNAELAAQLCRHCGSVAQRAYTLGLAKDPDWIKDNCRNLDPESGAAHRFKTGQESWNKGRKGYTTGGGSVESRFKPGHKPQTWVPVGTESRDKDGYLKRKIRDDAGPGQSRCNWRFVHVMVWEEANGPAPQGHCISFRNRDKNDIRLENLEIVTRREAMMRNSVHRLPEPLRKVIRAKGSLTRAINDREGRRGQEQA